MSELPPDTPDDGLLAAPQPPASVESTPLPEQTASGLHEEQISPLDLAALQAQFTFSSLTPGVPAEVEVLKGWELPQGLTKSQVQSAALAISEVRSARMKLAPLPDRIKAQQLRLTDLRAKVHRDIKPVLTQPIRRNRTAPHDLTKTEEAAVNKAFVGKFGSATKQLHLEGIYREVPLEAAKSVRLDDSLRFCVFTLAPGTNVNRLSTGYALAVAVGESGKTYPLLVRL